MSPLTAAQVVRSAPLTSKGTPGTTINVDSPLHAIISCTNIYLTAELVVSTMAVVALCAAIFSNWWSHGCTSFTTRPCHPPALSRVQALVRDESYWPAWYGLGQVKTEQSKHADAAEAFTRWVDGENAENRTAGGREGGRGRAVTSQARGLVQLGDAQRELGQVRPIAQYKSERTEGMSLE